MKSRRLKALFFIPSATGGAERMTVSIACCLPRDLYDVKFFIVSKEIGTIASFIPKEYEVKHVRIKNIYDFVTVRFIHIIKHEHADVVFSSMHYLNVRLIIASKICGNHVIVRSNTGLYRTPRSIVAMVKLSYKYADIIISQQDEMRTEICLIGRVPPDHVITMPNLLDEDTIKTKASEETPYDDSKKEVRYVIVGRADDPVKGQDVAIRALSIVRKTIDNAHLYIVGKYEKELPFCNKLYKLASDLDVLENVHFVGYDDNPYRWIQNANCFILSSRQEGMPNVLLEALFLHIPCVATNCVPVIDRIVSTGLNGYVVTTENPEEMAEGMIKALRLKRVEGIFKTSDKQDFANLFNRICIQSH